MGTLRAVVTGGSHGIGRGCAIAFARHGYDVGITSRSRREEALEVARMVEELGQKCYLVQADMHDPSVPERVVGELIEQLGGVDAIVCNAGQTKHYSILNVTNEDLDYLINLNFRSYLLSAKTAARWMVKNGVKGSILFTTSSRADRAYPEDMLYGGLKAGIKRACESIALDLSPYGIRANCIAPGGTLTDTVDELHPGSFDRLVPLGRLGTPIEVGEAAVYLSGPYAQYITGTTLRLDGGLVLAGVPESLPDSAEWLNPEGTKKQYDKLMEDE